MPACAELNAQVSKTIAAKFFMFILLERSKNVQLKRLNSRYHAIRQIVAIMVLLITEKSTSVKVSDTLVCFQYQPVNYPDRLRVYFKPPMNTARWLVVVAFSYLLSQQGANWLHPSPPISMRWRGGIWIKSVDFVKVINEQNWGSTHIICVTLSVTKSQEFAKNHNLS